MGISGLQGQVFLAILTQNWQERNNKMINKQLTPLILVLEYAKHREFVQNIDNKQFTP